jgi:TnpA family transposase
MVAKTPRLLTAEQRDAFLRIPADLSERDLGRFYTLSARDLETIGRHRRPANRLGFAVHLGLLRFPGRTLADVPEIPERVVAYIAQQVDVDPAAFEQYGERDNTTSSTSTSCGVSSAFRTAAGHSCTHSARS